MKKLIPIFIFLLAIPVTLSCPASQPAFLYAKETAFYSERFTFLNSSMVPENYSYEYNVPFPMYAYFDFNGDYENISIFLDGEEIFNSRLDILKRDEDAYILPWRELYSKTHQKTFDDNINWEKYEGSSIRIYLDEELVREFILGVNPGKIIKCRSSEQMLLEAILILAAILSPIIAVIAGLVYLFFKNRELFKFALFVVIFFVVIFYLAINLTRGDWGIYMNPLEFFGLVFLVMVFITFYLWKRGKKK
ncbi:MAG: hypothetical protein JSV92_03035 [archaeon]|nr:MAG: hypothetical protein JSV92_03035 [archaeon]